MNDYSDIVYIWYSCKREFFVFDLMLHLTFITVIYFSGGMSEWNWNFTVELKIRSNILLKIQ